MSSKKDDQIIKSESNLKEILENLELGNHLCYIYKDKERSLESIFYFIITGLERNEKCIYVVDERSKEMIIEYFEKKNFDLQPYMDSGQISFLTSKDTYLKDGYFDPDEMITLIKKNERKALEEGYEGLRITGEMTWVFSDLPGTERLMEYEMKLNQFFLESNAMGLCQYNENRFGPDILLDVIYNHPKVLIEDAFYDNPFYMPPDVFLSRLKGEVDKKYYQRIKEEITERGLLEKKEKLAKSSLKRASVEVYWITPEGKFLFSNETAKERLGFSKKEFNKMYVWDIDPNYTKERREEFWEELKENKTKTFQSIHEDKQGNTFPVEITSQYVKMDGEEYEFAFAKDITEKVETETELKEKHRELETLLSNLPGMAFRCLYNKDWTMKFVSEGAKELTSYDPEELIDGKEKNYGDIIVPEDREMVWEEIKSSIEKRKPYKINYRIETKNGEVKWVWEQGRGIFDEEGNVKYIEGFIEDVSDRKNMEQKLKEEQDRFKSLAETSPFSIFVYRNKFLYVNPEAVEMTGYSEDELLDMNFWDAVAPEHRDMVKERGIARTKEDQEEPPRSYEFKIQRKDGEKKWVHFTGARITYEGKKAGIGTALDITERKEYEQELRKVNEFREKIIQDANIWVIVINEEGNVTVWNKAAEEISGYAKEEVKGHSKIWEWLYPDDEYRREVTRKANNILEGESVEDFETTILPKDGEEKTIRWTSHPLKRGNGKIMGSVAFGIDITKQKEAEERRDFLDTLMRQDLQSKYQTMQGYLQLLLTEDISEEHMDFIKKAEYIGREANSILKLARDLQEIERTKWRAENDVDKIIEHVLDSTSTLREQTNVELKEKCPKDISKVIGDYSLKTLLTQLIKTRIQTGECENIILKADEEKDKVIINLMDDGDKLPDDIKGLFEGEIYEGFTAGVGGVRYYMIKEIAKHNNAKISVDESEKYGAKFKIHLQKA